MGPIKERLVLLEQVGEESIGPPGTVSAWNMHGLSSDIDRLTICVLDRANQASLLLFHVPFHDLIVGIKLLANRFIDTSDILGCNQVEFLLISDTIWLDQSLLLPIICILDTLVDGRDTILNLTFLVK